MIFGTDDVLPGFQWDEEACAFAVGDDAGNGEGMIDEGYGVANFDVAGLGDDIVGERFIGSLEGTPGAKDETLAEGVEPFVINAVDDDETFGIREDERGGGFVNVGKLGDLVAKGFGHHGAGKSEKDRGVGRLNEKIGADTFNALAPLGDNTAGETDNHEDQNNLDGDGEDAECATQGSRGKIAPEHSQKRKGTVVRVWHRKFGK